MNERSATGSFEMQEDWMWLSLRSRRSAGGPDTESGSIAHERTRPDEIRTVDVRFNPCLDGNYPIFSIDELSGFLKSRILKVPRSADEYQLLISDAERKNGFLAHPMLRLLGYDLTDESWASALFGCGRWSGRLEPIAGRRRANGLLNYEDAVEAKRILPEVWFGVPCGGLTIWAMYEIVTFGSRPPVS